MKYRILLALSILISIISLGNNSLTWSDRTNCGTLPCGTVTTINSEILVKGNNNVVIGNCAIVIIRDAPSDATYKIYVVPERDLPKPRPGNLVACAIKVKESPYSLLSGNVQVIWPMFDGTNDMAYYYNRVWIKSIDKQLKNQVSVTATKDSPDVVYFGVFNNQK